MEIVKRERSIFPQFFKCQKHYEEIYGNKLVDLYETDNFLGKYDSKIASEIIINVISYTIRP